MKNKEELISIYELLSDEDKNTILNLAKKLLLAYDADYTKVLSSEKEAVDKALKDYQKGVNICSDSEINW